MKSNKQIRAMLSSLSYKNTYGTVKVQKKVEFDRTSLLKMTVQPLKALCLKHRCHPTSGTGHNGRVIKEDYIDALMAFAK